ncbi:hypothetical protein AUR64_08750 [Haloprofundus marisrubri]|uniref:Cardiolipin synthase N-terminal domain-containing protein n=1 Tax=Haloprofundus marisrubri TaxID=1514971 RepID=A0A0W1R8G7_9EURY|nr:hypothetical protein [Haloprofundus marisrubri]KTG09720.1 hypothetical protein AUR64_08750 [Haloprofundus marisrubri]
MSSFFSIPLFGSTPDGAVLTVFLLLAATAWIVPVAGSVWVYRNAEMRTDTNSEAWTLATLLSGGLAMVLYVLMRGEKSHSPTDSDESTVDEDRDDF